MSIARALAILGAGASGFQGGQEQARQRSRQEEDDAFRREQRDRQRTDWSRSDEKYAREKADMEAERKNMAPVEGNPVFPTGDDEGNAMPMTPDMQRFTVAGTPGVLDASGVAAQNTPESRIRRAAAGAPDPARAAALNAQANASETAALQLDQARQTAVQQAWKRKAGAQIVGSQSWDAATKFMTESKADGMDGQTKWSYEESPDGKTVTIFSIDKDGKRGKGQQFENSDMGRMKLFTLLDTSTPIEAKLKDQQAEENRRRDDARQDRQQASTERYQQGMLDVQRGELGIRSNEARLRRAALDAEARIPPAVKMQYASIDKELATLNSAITKAQAEGQFDPKSPQAQALMLRQRELTTTAQRILQPYIGDGGGAASSGDPLGLFGDKPQANDKMAAVKADMAKSGTTGANFDIGGVKGSIGTPSRPVPQPRMQSAAAAPGSGGDPLKGLSRQKVREKRGEIAAEIKRWEGDPNAKARIDELRTLLERIDNGQY